MQTPATITMANENMTAQGSVSQSERTTSEQPLFASARYFDGAAWYVCTGNELPCDTTTPAKYRIGIAKALAWHNKHRLRE